MTKITKADIQYVVSHHDITRPDNHYIEGGKGLTRGSNRFGVTVESAIDSYVGLLAEQYRGKVEQARGVLHQSPEWKGTSTKLKEVQNNIESYREGIARGGKKAPVYISKVSDEMFKAQKYLNHLKSLEKMAFSDLQKEFETKAFRVGVDVVNAYDKAVATAKEQYAEEFKTAWQEHQNIKETNF